MSKKSELKSIAKKAVGFGAFTTLLWKSFFAYLAYNNKDFSTIPNKHWFSWKPREFDAMVFTAGVVCATPGLFAYHAFNHLLDNHRQSRK